MELTKTGKTKSLWTRIMGFLARRDHSEKELVEKLKSHYPLDDIERAIAEMKDRGWILPPRELSQKVCESLNRKNKSHLFIRHFLKKKGLPTIPKDEDMELQKARAVLTRHLWKRDGTKKGQAVSLLRNRGFDTETIGKVLHETLGSSSGFY